MTELLASVGGDPDFLAELVGDFLADAPTQLGLLRQAATTGDSDGARRAAHTLKGNARTFGAPELAARCEATERAAAAAELDTVVANLDGVEEEWDRVQAALTAMGDGGT